MKKVSIIIPCYNVESYIARCLDSVVNQTCGIANLEVMLVNDGSTDDTYEYLLEYESRYSENICVINLEQNQGIGFARNIALDYCTGEYVMFVDSDDWIELDMVEKMYACAEKYNTDFVMCKNDRPSSLEEAVHERIAPDEFYVVENEEQRKEIVMYIRSKVIPWGKLIRREVLTKNQILFPEKVLYEDNYWAFLLFLHSDSIYLLNEQLYHYFNNPSSVVNERRNVTDIITVQVSLFEELVKRGFYQKFKDEIDYNFYQKTFVEFIYSSICKRQVSPLLVEKTKDLIMKNCNGFDQNRYYLSGGKGVWMTSYIQPLFEGQVTESMIEYIYDQLVTN